MGSLSSNRLSSQVWESNKVVTWKKECSAITQTDGRYIYFVLSINPRNDSILRSAKWNLEQFVGMLPRPSRLQGQTTCFRIGRDKIRLRKTNLLLLEIWWVLWEPIILFDAPFACECSTMRFRPVTDVTIATRHARE